MPMCMAIQIHTDGNDVKIVCIMHSIFTVTQLAVEPPRTGPIYMSETNLLINVQCTLLCPGT